MVMYARLSIGVWGKLLYLKLEDMDGISSAAARSSMNISCGIDYRICIDGIVRKAKGRWNEQEGASNELGRVIG